MDHILSFEKLFEASPRIPRLGERGIEYWKSKGKTGTDVMLYTHDDMDGIYSAIAVKKRLQDLGYNIIGYGILNYQEGWEFTSLDPKVINVAVDFANMPEPERKDLIDIYIDHHGVFTEEEQEMYQKSPVIKTKTGSAYEGICLVLGKPTDEIALYSIDMIDSAKYDDYAVDWRDILNFNWDLFKQIASKEGKVEIKPFKGSKSVKLGWPIIAKLTFAGAFNQFLKRSDHKTLIEVIDNVNDVSIYAIYNAMKRLYPGNNIWKAGSSAGEQKDFVKDSSDRIESMKKRTRGDSQKPIYTDQTEFVEGTGMKPKGYQIIGNLMFVPSGTWANALRARAILLQDYDSGVVPSDHRIDFIMLQYGNTIQVCSFEKMENMKTKPVTSSGHVIEDLGEYMGKLLNEFKRDWGYYDPDTTIGQEELTVSGGHVGIGTISNIIKKIDAEKLFDSNRDLSDVAINNIDEYDGMRYLDIFKNRIIADLSGLGEANWPIGLVWSGDAEDPIKILIRNIMNNDEKLKADIQKKADEIEAAEARTPIGAMRKARSETVSELMELDRDYIEDWHQAVMTGHKVVMRPDIRKIQPTGEIKESHIIGFKDFTY